jgi:hypothetical protein
MNDVSLSLPDSMHLDPWRVFIDVAAESTDGLERSLLWLRVMAHSAVDIPPQTLKQLLGLARDLHAPFPMVVSLLESTMTSMWLKTFGSEGLEVAMVQVNVIWANDLLFRMRGDEEIEDMCASFLIELGVSYRFISIALTSFATL